MLSPKTQLNLRNAKAYFREHLSAGDYYGEGQTVTGQWFGLGAEKLGLNGQVTEQEFLALCEGRNPATGARLTQRLNSERRQANGRVANRRVFYDFTISPPKSVSVVAFLRDARVIGLHDEAVRQAMAELEPLAGARVRKGGAFRDRFTANVVGAAFRHDTSRELDPHLHTHCVLFNATFDAAEGRWKALEAAELFRAQKFAEQTYFHVLCRGLRKLGYEIEPSRHNFEIKGVPASVLTLFSKRRAQIDAEARRQSAKAVEKESLPVLRARVAHDLRRRKAHHTNSEDLRWGWEKQLFAADAKVLRSLSTSRRVDAAPVDVAELAAWADEHVFERKAVASEPELLEAALARGRGRDFSVPDLRAALRSRDYVREGESVKLTARDALRCELELVFAAQDGRSAHAPLAPGFKPAAGLSAEQERAVGQILRSRDFITLFRGGAGTGKSFALREVHRGLLTAGRSVVVVTPQRQQAVDLAKDGLPADTVAAVLTRGAVPAGAVVLVDEAGQIGGRDLANLVRLAKAHRGRLILSGDTRQHGAVAASDALRAIEAYGHLAPAEVAAIRRQDPERGQDATERVTIERYRAAIKAIAAGDASASLDIVDRLGWVREAGDGTRHRAVAREFAAAQARGESVLVVAPTWAEVNALNAAIRKELAGAGRLGPERAVTAFQAVDTTIAQRRDPTFYAPGHSAHFVQRYGRFAKGDVCPIIKATERGLVVVKDGRRSTMSFRYAERIAVVRPSELALASGVRLQLKFNGRSLEGKPLVNGELVTVRAIRADGSIVVAADDGTRKTLSAGQRVFNLGYAITSYGSQGKTVDTVLLSDAGQHAATNRNQWYVALSRGRKRALVFTADKAALRADIVRDGGRPLAVDLQAGPVQAALAKSVAPRWVDRARTVVATLHRLDFLRRRRENATTVRPTAPTLRPHL